MELSAAFEETVAAVDFETEADDVTFVDEAFELWTLTDEDWAAAEDED